MIEISAGSVPHLVVFPHGTTLNKNEEVILPDGIRFRDGDEVGLGGGFHPAEWNGGDSGRIPQDCLTEEIFWASGEVAD